MSDPSPYPDSRQNQAQRTLDRCSTGAAYLDGLAAEAEQADNTEGAARYRQAAAATRAYTDKFAEQVAGGAVTDAQIEQADVVAHGAGMNGWLSTGYASAGPHHEAMTELAQQGVFTHREAEPGKTVARWELTPPAEDTPQQAAEHSDGDEF